MDSSDNWLLCNKLKALVAELEGKDADAAESVWKRMELALARADAEEDAEIALPVLDRSVEEMLAVFRGWADGSLHLPEWDKAVLKRALKAYRKRLKIARLDDEASSSRNPLSKGAESGILGVRPPEQYPQDIWDMLVAQGKLRDAGHGLLELATV